MMQLYGVMLALTLSHFHPKDEAFHKSDIKIKQLK
jgi:hypothetical protein